MAGDQCLAAGMNDHLAKPISFPALERMLDHWGMGNAAGAA